MSYLAVIIGLLFITAGNTGAAMATAKMVLGAIPGVDRPDEVKPSLDIGRALANAPIRRSRLKSGAGIGSTQ